MPRAIRFALPLLALLACAATVRAASAATFEGRNVDARWYEGRAVSTTYGAYRCQIQFHGDRVFFRPEGSSVQVVADLDEEIISDPRDILARDPKRGVNWTLEVFNIRH